MKSKKQKTPKFKNTYLIDMDAVRTKPLEYTQNGIILPIKLKNGTKPASNESTKLFAERPVLRMLEQYPVLFPMVKNGAANTITEYLDTKGNPLICIYPNNDSEQYNQDWQSHFDANAMKDLITLYEEHKNTIESARGALHQIKKK